MSYLFLKTATGTLLNIAHVMSISPMVRHNDGVTESWRLTAKFVDEDCPRVIHEAGLGTEADANDLINEIEQRIDALSYSGGVVSIPEIMDSLKDAKDPVEFLPEFLPRPVFADEEEMPSPWPDETDETPVAVGSEREAALKNAMLASIFTVASEDNNVR